MDKYVVTAFDRNMGRRVNLTLSNTKEHSLAVAKDQKRTMSIAIPKYKIFSNIKVEKATKKNVVFTR